MHYDSHVRAWRIFSVFVQRQVDAIEQSDREFKASVVLNRPVSSDRRPELSRQTGAILS